MPHATLRALLDALKSAEIVPRPDAKDWSALINRISVPNTIAEIDEETFTYFLEVLPPKFMHGSTFAFAEGAEELRLFWQDRDRCFCRQLTADETQQFCALARIPLPW